MDSLLLSHLSWHESAEVGVSSEYTQRILAAFPSGNTVM